MARSRGLLVIILLIASCAAPKLILSPDTHLQLVGKEAANRDIAACREMDKDAGATSCLARVGRSQAALR